MKRGDQTQDKIKKGVDSRNETSVLTVREPLKDCQIRKERYYFKSDNVNFRL